MSFDMDGLLKQARDVQERMREMQSELANEHVESISGGGMIKVIVNGQQEVIKIEISPEAMEAGAEMLSDMVLVTITDAMKKSREPSRSSFCKTRKSPETSLLRYCPKSLAKSLPSIFYPFTKKLLV